MWKVTWKGLLAHKLRFVLTGIAVLLGVAFVSGTFVLTATINATFDDLFTEIFAGTDAQVRGVEPVDAVFGPGSAPRAPVSEAVLDIVSEVDGVAVANPGVDVPYAQLVDSSGKEIGGGVGPPTFGISWDDNPDLNPFRLEPGSEEPRDDDEIVIDRGTADEGDFEVGDRVDVLTLLPTKEYTIVGIAKFGSQDSPLGASVVQFTLDEAQRINGMEPDQFSNIGIVADPDVSQEEIRDRIRSQIDDPNIEVVTGKELTEENQDDVDQILNVFNRILLIFALVALLVSSFLIYNTFMIVVAQRSREMALLRAIGASTRQVGTTILAESVAVGFLASALGFGLGVLLAQVLKALLDAIGFDIPAAGIVVPVIAPVASFLVGMIVTVASAMIPARRASRVPPVAAMREVAIEHRVGFGRRLAIGSVITIGGAALILFALFASPSDALEILGVGALALFVGVFVVGPVIARPLSRLIGSPLPRLRGVTGTLARENAMRNPRRTAATASALMIGVSLVGFITIFAASTKKSIASTLDRELRTDFIVSAFSGFGGVGLSPALADELTSLPEVSAVSAARYAGFEVGGKGQFVSAFDTDVLDELVNLTVVSGAMADIGADGIGLSEEYADDNDLRVGDTILIAYPATGTRPTPVRAIYEGSELGMSGDFVISLESYDANFFPQQRLDFFILAKLAQGVTPTEGEAVIAPLLEPYPTAELQNNAEFRESQEEAINTVVNLVYLLLALAVFIAVIGIANTLALSIYERTHELGLLRAVGMNRRQMRSTVRWESVIIAVLGALLGLAIALFFGWSVVRAVREDGFTDFDAAPAQLVVVAIAAGIAGVGAAIFPARRAARLDVLQAIATE